VNEIPIKLAGIQRFNGHWNTETASRSGAFFSTPVLLFWRKK